MSNVEKAAVTELKALCMSSGKSAKISVNARDFYSLSYRCNGKISVETCKEALFSEGGSVTFIPKGLSYKTEILEDTRMVVVHFKLDRDIDFRNAAVIKTSDGGIPLLFEKLVRDFHVDSPVDFHCMSNFYELLARLEKLSQKEQTKQAPKKIRVIKDYMEKCYSNSSLNVEGIAYEFGISTSYLRREFSRIYGISPVSFLRDVRVGNAKIMLESGYLSITEIAQQCGFSSPSYFIQVFRKIVGQSPDRYRRGLIDDGF